MSGISPDGITYPCTIGALDADVAGGGGGEFGSPAEPGRRLIAAE